MATIFCMNCGITMPEETRFCPECGSPTLKEIGFEEPGTRRRVPPYVAVTREGSRPGSRVQAESHLRVTCPVCGAVNSDLSRFCGACGEPLHSAPVASTTRDEALQPVMSEHNREERSQGIRRRTVAYGLAALGVLAILIGGAAFAMKLLNRGDAADSAVELPVDQSADEAIPTEATGEVGAMGTAGTVVHATLSDYSWSELSIIARHMSATLSREKALACAQEYHLVDEAGRIVDDTIDVSIEGVGTVPMRIVGIYHDDLASGEGKAGLTFLAADLTLTHAMKDVDDNVGGWEQSRLRLWLQEELPHSFDPALYALIVPVDKHTNNAGQTMSTTSVTSTFDALWVPSVVEICGPVEWDWTSDSANSGSYNAVLNAEGSQYELFSQLGVTSVENNSSLAMTGAYGAISWWTRSCSASKSAHYRIVDAAGNPSRFAAAPEIMGVCLGFCL
jgi:hypothetical protein